MYSPPPPTKLFVLPDDESLLAGLAQFLSQLVMLKVKNNLSAEAFQNHLSCIRALPDFDTLAISTALAKLTSFKAVLAFLSSRGPSDKAVTYDLCGNADCCVVYRCEIMGETSCPACSAPRYGKGNVALRRMVVLPIEPWLMGLRGDARINQSLDWWSKGFSNGGRPVTPGCQSDVYDTRVWSLFEDLMKTLQIRVEAMTSRPSGTTAETLAMTAPTTVFSHSTITAWSALETRFTASFLRLRSGGGIWLR